MTEPTHQHRRERTGSDPPIAIRRMKLERIRASELERARRSAARLLHEERQWQLETLQHQRGEVALMALLDAVERVVHNITTTANRAGQFDRTGEYVRQAA